MDKFSEDKVHLLDIAKSIDEVEALGGGIGFQEFTKQDHIRDDIAYQLREIGVAARLLSEEFKATYGDIDWDVLINLQFATWDQEAEIDPHAIWYIIENDLPQIKDQIFDIASVLENREDEFYF